MPILTLQKRARELGRIRIGKKGDKGQPQKLDRFRVTSASQALIEKVAELYGGTAQAWDNNGVPQWEVITDARRIPIMVPPQPVSQWLETWAGGSKGCVHRCDGHTNVLTDELCDPNDPDHINAKPTTRLNVVLRDVEGIGVFRLESHGWNAAVELPDMAAFLAQAGGYVNGWLSLEERVSKSEGQTKRFIVPLIEIDVTPAELMAGKGRIQPPSVEGPVERPALNAGASLPTIDDIAAASDLAALTAIRAELEKAGALTDEINAAGAKRYQQLTAPPAQQPDEDGAVDAEVIDDEPPGDPDVLWQQILSVGGQLGMTLGDVNDEYAAQHDGELPDAASAAQLAEFLRGLRQAAAA